MSEIDKKRVIDLLNRILESELAGVIRYTHYSFLVYGYTRIPIVSWLRDQATESLTHAQLAGEMITHLGAYPSLAIGPPRMVGLLLYPVTSGRPTRPQPDHLAGWLNGD